MKKLMIAVAAVACATVGFADDITSANTVGYTGKDVEQAKFEIIAAQFDTVGKTTRDLNDLMTGIKAVNYTDKKTIGSLAPQILMLNDKGGYTTCYYINDAWYDDGSEEGDYKKGFSDLYGNFVEVEVGEGESFWFKNPTVEDKPNVAGEVSNDSTVDVACEQGFQLVANTFPIAITLNTDAMTSADIVGVNYTDKKTIGNVATQILFLNDKGGYTTCYYINDAWYDDGTEEGDYKAGWADLFGNLVEDATIPVMTGFWTKGVSGAFTLTFKGISK